MKFLLNIAAATLISLTGFGQTPSQKELQSLADTFCIHGILAKEKLAQVHTDINNNQIKNGAFDLLSYCNNARVINLHVYKTGARDLNVYIHNIYKDIASVIPAFDTKRLAVSGYSFEEKTCGKADPDQMFKIFYPAKNKKQAGYNWNLSEQVKDSADSIPEFTYQECISTESELIFVLNRMLRAENSPWQIALVRKYNPVNTIMTPDDSVFGVVAFSRMQIDLFDPVVPWMGLNTGFITHENAVKETEIFRSLGLFDHVNKSQADSSIQYAMHKPCTNFNDFLSFIPGVSYSFDWKSPSIKKSYAHILSELSKISRGAFIPENTQDDSYNAWNKGNGLVSLGFILNGKKYESNLSGYVFLADEFISVVNRSLSESGAKGKFYYLYPSARGGNKNSVTMIYLTDEQYKKLEEQRTLSFIKAYQLDSGTSLLMNYMTESFWEKNY